VQVLKQRYAGMKIVVGRDKLDIIQVRFTSAPSFASTNIIKQGVRHKILAFETFLERYPEFQQKVIVNSPCIYHKLISHAQVVLIQVALQTTESNETAGGVADVVSHINSRFSTLTYQPVVFLHTQDLTFSQYLALLTVADAFLVTSLREGMALR
jgi:trehalose 6-phosphate synthase/phosphatase